jgi:4-hydroxybenzoate polyprenyltransferase
MLSLIREMVKDLEDRKGDEQFGCRSLPIVKGDAFTRRTVKGLTLLLFVLLVFAQYRLAGMYFPLVIGWLIVFVEIPLLIFLYLLHKADSSRSYHSCSTFLKWIMVGGILSMVIIRINFNM